MRCSAARRAPAPTRSPPLEDRHNIPNLGPCIRCNFQLEGSGVSADDVMVDAGNVASGNGPPIGSVKDVGLRVDRADGFVLRNMSFRHAKEHDVYVLESDGYLLDRFKAYWAGEYGVLTFVEDHGLIQNCDAAGSGDSGLYPGAGADTGSERDVKYYPEFRYSQEIRFCDSHHNLAGYSGTDGNATHVDHNNFYDNSLGFTTDVFTAPGHPGFPQDSDLIEYNNFYSNNFNVYDPKSGIEGAEPEPVGTGLWIAGGNSNVVRFNHFYDNWRRGTMLFAAPDATICGPAIGTPVTGCDPSKVSTSYDNRFYGNVMGVAPDGKVMPNGDGLLVGQLPERHRQLLVSQPARAGREHHDVPEPAAGLRERHKPARQHRHGRRRQRGRVGGLPARDRERRGLQPDALPVVHRATQARQQRGPGAGAGSGAARAGRIPGVLLAQCDDDHVRAVRAAAGGPMRGASIAAALSAAALLAGCGGGGGATRLAADGAPPIPLATFKCGQWQAARADIQQTVIDELHGFYGLPVSGQRRTAAIRDGADRFAGPQPVRWLVLAAVRRQLHALQALRARGRVRRYGALGIVGRR